MRMDGSVQRGRLIANDAVGQSAIGSNGGKSGAIPVRVLQHSARE